MIAKLFKIGLPLLVLGLGIGAYVHFRRANARLSQQVVAARERNERTARLRENNEKLRTIVARAKADEGDGLRAIHAEAAQARNEVANLERQAGERYTAKVAKDEAAAEALQSNRAPTKGPMLVDNCRDVGRGSPAAALQTLVWASVKGDDEAVAGMIVLDGKARGLVAALLATLPPEAREKYPTPEKMAALVLADMLLNVSTIQVVAQSPLDSQRVVVTVGNLSGKTIDLVMAAGPDGWQVVTADRKIFEQFKAKIVGAGPPPAPAKK